MEPITHIQVHVTPARPRPIKARYVLLGILAVAVLLKTAPVLVYLGAAVLLCRVLYRPGRAAILAASGGYREYARLRQARVDGLRARADYQHAAYLRGDPAGTYGAFAPSAPPERQLPHRDCDTRRS
jgi:hypothetical protein